MSVKSIRCPIRHFSFQKSAAMMLVTCGRYVSLMYTTDASFTVDFYLTVKVTLRHERVDSEEDREGLGFDLGQGLCMLNYVT